MHNINHFLRGYRFLQLNPTAQISGLITSLVYSTFLFFVVLILAANRIPLLSGGFAILICMLF